MIVAINNTHILIPEASLKGMQTKNDRFHIICSGLQEVLNRLFKYLHWKLNVLTRMFYVEVLILGVICCGSASQWGQNLNTRRRSLRFTPGLRGVAFPCTKRIFPSPVSLWIVCARRELMERNGLPCAPRLDSGESGSLRAYLVYCSGGRPDYLDKPVGSFGQSPIAIQVGLELMKKQGEALISITPRSDAKKPSW